MIGKRSKREPPTPSVGKNSDPLTPSTSLKIGEYFVVLRRAPHKGGFIEEKCIATIVEIRDGEEIESPGDQSTTEAPSVPSDEIGLEVRRVCTHLLNRVSGEDNTPDVDSRTRKEQRKMYYVHYDGMDRRLDEWVERNRILERANLSSVPAGLCRKLSIQSANPLLRSSLEKGTMTRSQRRIHEEFHHMQKGYDDMDATTAALEKEHAELTKVKNIERIRFGDYEIDAWYASPYPDEYGKLPMLYICEYCMAYMRSEAEYCCHMLHYCDRRQPPGDEIYRDGKLSIYEVDGKANKVYCQCLCLLSKLFLDHKTLFFDVETFLFYVLCEVDQVGAHIVGHFSKERLSLNNLACIMVLPPFQRKGYGKLLIQLSYELSSREGLIGTPEKPLSDLGKVGYRSYWWWVLLNTIDSLNIDDITVSDLSAASGIAEDDIISTLQTMQLIKYWKGDHVVTASRRIVEYCRSVNIGRPPKLLLNPDYLRWIPKARRE